MAIEINRDVLEALAAGSTSTAQIRDNWPEISENLKQSMGGMTMAEFGEYVASGQAMADLIPVIQPAYEARGRRS
jgi:hypothetical protein